MTIERECEVLIKVIDDDIARLFKEESKDEKDKQSKETRRNKLSILKEGLIQIQREKTLKDTILPYFLASYDPKKDRYIDQFTYGSLKGLLNKVALDELLGAESSSQTYRNFDRIFHFTQFAGSAEFRAECFLGLGYEPAILAFFKDIGPANTTKFLKAYLQDEQELIKKFDAVLAKAFKPAEHKSDAAKSAGGSCAVGKGVVAAAQGSLPPAEDVLQFSKMFSGGAGAGVGAGVSQAVVRAAEAVPAAAVDLEQEPGAGLPIAGPIG